MSRRRRIWLIVHTELRRRYRVIRASGRTFALLVALGAIGVLVALGAVLSSYVLGRAVGTGALTPPLALGRRIGAGVVLAMAVVVGLRVIQDSAMPPHPDGLLTSVAHAEATLGVVISELAVTVGVVAVPGLLAGLAFGLGTGTALAAVGAVGAVAGALALGGLLGFAGGLAVRNLLARSPVLARFRTALGVAVFIAYFAIIFSQAGDDAVGPVLDVLAVTPLGWFGDLALVTVGGRPGPALAAGATAALGSALLLTACVRLTAALWYIDPVRPRTDGDRSGGLGGLAVVDRPTGRIIRKTWRRARRNPIRLVYVAYPVFLLYPAVADSVETGVVPATLPPLVALYGAWATGAAFTLNPLGDEGPVLPVTVTTPVGGRRYVGALCLAALLLGVPITAGGALIAGLLSPLTLPTVALVTLVAVALTAAGTGLAAGIGTLFPRLDAVRITRSRRAVVPSLLAFGVYSLTLTLVGLPATTAGVPAVADFVSQQATVAPATVAVGGLVTSAALGGVVAAVSFRYAARSFDRFRYD